jgi:bacteriorhodopsin
MMLGRFFALPMFLTFALMISFPILFFFQAHMDPSEIRAIPYSLKKLTYFVMLPAVLVMLEWLVTTPQKMMTNLLKLTKLTAIIYALFGLCGSQIVTDYQHSLTAAVYVACLASTTWTDSTSSHILEELPFRNFTKHVMKFCQIYGMVVVSIPFQIIAVLDRGLQIQRWPLPVVLGATYGYVMGSIAGIFFSYYERKALEKEEKAKR